ncbi:hypothetical protein XAC3608_2050012 [Xanthomonas citri pv. citri]|nr:hypothetical protein XAC3608_2050012 [Xanthomonas citri pv. citri]
MAMRSAPRRGRRVRGQARQQPRTERHRRRVPAYPRILRWPALHDHQSPRRHRRGDHLALRRDHRLRAAGTEGFCCHLGRDGAPVRSQARPAPHRPAGDVVPRHCTTGHQDDVPARAARGEQPQRSALAGHVPAVRDVPRDQDGGLGRRRMKVKTYDLRPAACMAAPRDRQRAARGRAQRRFRGAVRGSDRRPHQAIHVGRGLVLPSVG